VIDSEPLKHFIRRDFLFDKDAPLPDDRELFPDVIDSLGVMEVVSFVEETYGVEIPEDELQATNFKTVSAIVALVERRSA
jgi:methoxymalonate biosynthesis acyl carrier protein